MRAPRASRTAAPWREPRPISTASAACRLAGTCRDPEAALRSRVPRRRPPRYSRRAVKALRVDHLAFPSFDSARTHRFCTEVLGFPLTFAMSGLSRTWGKRYLLTAYAVGGGA